MWWCLSDAVASLMPLHHEATQHCHPWGGGGGGSRVVCTIVHLGEGLRPFIRRVSLIFPLDIF